MTVLAVVGMQREARIVAAPTVRTVVAGSITKTLAVNIERALTSEVRGIVSIGIAGGLEPSLTPGDCIIASDITSFDDEAFDVNERWRKQLEERLPQARVGRIVGSDVLAIEPLLKSAFWKQSHAFAVDTESHIAARVAQARGVPFAALRVISDAADRSLPPAALVAMKPDGSIALGRVLKSIAFSPTQIPALIRTSRESEKAFAALLRCRDALGPGLGCPYLGLL